LNSRGKNARSREKGAGGKRSFFAGRLFPESEHHRAGGGGTPLPGTGGGRKQEEYREEQRSGNAFFHVCPAAYLS
jgi:hypothetical protein